MTGNQARPGAGSRTPSGYMILTPAQIEVTAGEDFSSSVTVWPAGPRHSVSASVPDGSGLRVEVAGHKVIVTGCLDCAGEQHDVVVTTVRDGAEVAHDVLTIEAATLAARQAVPRPAPFTARSRRLGG